MFSQGRILYAQFSCFFVEELSWKSYSAFTSIHGRRETNTITESERSWAWDPTFHLWVCLPGLIFFCRGLQSPSCLCLPVGKPGFHFHRSSRGNDLMIFTSALWMRPTPDTKETNGDIHGFYKALRWALTLHLY